MKGLTKKHQETRGSPFFDLTPLSGMSKGLSGKTPDEARRFQFFLELQNGSLLTTNKL